MALSGSMTRGRQTQESHSGSQLRQLRLACGLTLRDVEQASLQIAKVRQNRKMIIPPSRLSDVEQRGIVPNIYRLTALAKIYGVNLQALLSFYGV